MAHLVVCRGLRFDRVLELGRDLVSLGADPEADHRLADPALPRGRVLFERTGAGWQVSAPPELYLRLNGRPPGAGTAAVANGDRVEVGPFTLHVVLPTVPLRETALRRRELDALFKLAEGVHAAVGSASLVDGIMDSLLHLFSAERGFILQQPESGPGRSSGSMPGSRGDPGSSTAAQPRPEPREADLVPVVARKLDIASSDRFSQTVAREVFGSGQAKLIRDTTSHPRLQAQASVMAAQIHSIIAAPLLRGAQPVGVIYLDVSGFERQFDETDLALLEASAAHVLAALDNGRERERLRRSADAMREVAVQEVRREFDTHTIVGGSQGLTAVLDLVKSVAAQDTTVLVLGESGTGKELIARAIHDQSRRAAGPFVAVNCTALAPALLESELFGHEKGAFTGAHERRLGRFELADGGTIFLDEVGELAPGLQVKLLRVLQERLVERVGTARPRRIDVRLVCATNADLRRAVAERRFRDDLYYRIAVFPLRIPPLRERREDVGALTAHFIGLFGRRMGKPISGIEPDALEVLTRYAWPGNIRELRNVIERAFVVERGPRISTASLPFGLAEDAAPPPPPGPPTAGGALAGARDAFEKRFVLECLRRHQGRIAPAARELDVPRPTLYRKLEAWGVTLDPRSDG